MLRPTRLTSVLEKIAEISHLALRNPNFLRFQIQHNSVRLGLQWGLRSVSVATLVDLSLVSGRGTTTTADRKVRLNVP